MAKAKSVSRYEYLLFDRLLLVFLVLAGVAYVFRFDWVEPIFTVAAVFTGVLWSYRTATNYPNRNVRVGASIVFALLAAVSIYYLRYLQGRI